MTPAGAATGFPVVIPVAGRGTRLHPLTGDRPKCLLPVRGFSILERALRSVVPFRPPEIVLVVGWKGEVVRRTLGTVWQGIPLRYVRQPEPLGLAHALALGARDIQRPFLALHGDVVFAPEVELGGVVDAFLDSDNAAALLVEERPPQEVTRGAVRVGAGERVLELSEYPDAGARRWGRVAAGFYAFSPEAAELFAGGEPSEAGEYELPEALSRLLATGARVRAVTLRGRRVNVNTVDDLVRARSFFAAGDGPARPRVSVLGSGSHEYAERAEPLGRALARVGVNLVTGGGPGVMAAVARGFTAIRPREGISVGILPSAPLASTPPPGYPNPWVELPVMTHLDARGEGGTAPTSRNHLVVLSGGAAVALPGAAGTRTEVELALRYGRPVAAFLDDPGELPGLPQGVPVLSTIQDVVAFVLQALDGERTLAAPIPGEAMGESAGL